MGLSIKSAKIRNEKESALGNLVAGDIALKIAFVTTCFKTTERAVLGGSALYAGAPHAPGAWFHFSAHERNHLSFLEAKLQQNGIERRAIFPGHFNDAIDILLRKKFQVHTLQTTFDTFCFSCMKGVKKQDLPSKSCLTCGRPFTWRKKWEKNWDEVKYCSDRCRSQRNK